MTDSPTADPCAVCGGIGELDGGLSTCWCCHGAGVDPIQPEQPSSNPQVTPVEVDELIRWHMMCANLSTQSDDFAGARWHREKLAEWKAWRGGKRVAHETTEECKDCLKLIDERDRAEDWADDLAGDIAQLLGEEIGEHSSGNCPWGNAHDAAGYELDKRKRAAEKTSPVLDHRFQPDPIDDGICGTCGSTRLSHRGESPRTPAND
jgi:hypothetical protein